ncbi:SCO family protein [Roseomonas sp. M0104]|uniref:SCO family protein n=1 Tax=Teichococcus coralli TaxID=2545983 RepID=A0A845B5U6_9PROT|nr:SCO family protein [Pseudoroseomonas coralli]MXP62571.1 SCO family protein [Pseudoroseomonas coralli]
MRRVRLLALALLASLAAGSARAALTQASLSEVTLAPPPGARLPPGLALRDAAGQATTPAQAQGRRPAVLVLADYTCTVLCGTELGLASAALEKVKLRAGSDYTFLALGIDPKDGPAAAAAMKAAHFPQAPAEAVRFLVADAEGIQRTETALGYTAHYDAETDSYAHPLGLLVLTADGAVSRVLSGLEIDPPTLRLALVEAGQGRVGSLGEQLRLFCYGFDAARGIYNAWVERVLTIGTTVTVLLLGSFLAWAFWRERRA